MDDFVPPRGIALKGARRTLRVRPGEVAIEAERTALRLKFTLPTGSYATVLLEDVFGELRQGADEP